MFDALQRHYAYSEFRNASHVGGVGILSRWLPVADIEAGARYEVPGLLVRQLLSPVGPLHVGVIHLSWPWPYGQAPHRSAMEKQLVELQGPVVLGGDFNAAPWSAAVEALAAASRTTVAPGVTPTFQRKTWPVVGPLIRLRIDHVLVPEAWQASTTIVPLPGSDHAAVIATLEVGS